jgi:hypothetical protein
MSRIIMNPAFIMGTGRSGTTILKKVLAQHSEVVALRDELRIISDPDGVLDLVRCLCVDWSPYNADQAVRGFIQLIHDCGRSATEFGVKLEKVERHLFRKAGLLSPRRYLGTGLKEQFGTKNFEESLGKLVDFLVLNTTAGSWCGSSSLSWNNLIYETQPMEKVSVSRAVNDFFISLFSSLAYRREKKAEIWLDDTPSNILHSHKIINVFPSAKFIHIYRDPRDVLSSYLGFSWGGDNVSSTALRLRAIYDQWKSVKSLIPSESLIEVSLDEMANNFKAEYQRICEFLEVSVEEGGTELKADKMNSGRWRDNIQGFDRDDMESILSDHIAVYGR